ncbi:Lipid II flippase MurJ [Planctomycetes bacterium Poly30]|uniref:Lipid II flippase MurJ n=1 Tax=Saltatorellus ferox TaxID=2528018 RepID=A0A518F131_9BACT|nr:Lipid II flippase MurJ [Planctomycetes bacterium Poly30]
MSRVLGLVREAVASALFGGNSGIYDAFITAWRVPNLFRRFLGEGALSTSFQTALTAVDSDHGEVAGATLFWRTLKMLAGLLLGLCLVIMALVYLTPDRMPGTQWLWLGEDPAAVRELTLRLMPFVVLVCVSALFTGALHVRGSFAAPAFAPAAMNVIWILVLLLVAMQFGWFGASPEAPGELGVEGQLRHLEMARWLAIGVLVSGVVQLLVQLPALRAAGLLGGRASRTPLPTDAPKPLDVLKRSAPLALGAAVYQINVMVDGLMAEGLLPNGGPTAHYLANRVQQFPLALVAIAATSAVFPALQALGHKRDLRGLRKLHDTTHLAIAAVAVPAACGLFALSQPVLEVLFERGSYQSDDVLRTTPALQALCLAILPAGATGLIARTYYAMGDFLTPVKISVSMLFLNALLNTWFLVGLGMDVEGLAAGTAITSALNAAALLPGLTSRLGLPACGVPMRGALGKILVASLIAAAAASGAEALLDGIVGRTAALTVAIGVGGGTYAAGGMLLGVDVVRVIARKFLGRRSRS